MNAPIRPGAGLSLKPDYFQAARDCRAGGLWFEVHPENYMVDGGPRLAWLDAIAERHPLSLHGVAMSLAAPAAPDARHLRRFRKLVERVDPMLVSEHLAWSATGGHYYPDLLPFPRSDEALAVIADNIARVQDSLGRRIAIENPTHYMPVPGHRYTEQAFLAELCERSGCGLLLDINNVFISAHNLGFDAQRYLLDFPLSAVMEIHLAGHSVDAPDQAEDTGETLLIDSHDQPVADPVWELYRAVIERAGPVPTLIERDGNIPSFDILLAERARAQALLERLESMP
ncbi:hypothetical protein CEK62_11410 [Alcanivorax sp. N3-2A]|nr:hypothetical protein CEK62_11410 [Alcanivorax sp. N3-2A]|tara:strand:- start:5199 stop:6056 length:858 start_codon:yes stop_codon:yes gene_type:complete